MTQLRTNRKFWEKTAYMGLFLALAMICSYVEALLPFSFGIPGIKLGLTNSVVILALYCVGPVEAFGISVLRILLSGLLFGNLFSVLYSLGGGILSFFVMFFLKKKTSLSCFSISCAGGIAHNIGQLIIAALFVQNLAVYYYLPVLLVAGAITGILIGLLAQEIIKRIGSLIHF